MNDKKKTIYWALGIVAIYVAAYLFYILLNGEDIYVIAHDTLDSGVVWYKILQNNRAFFAFDEPLPILKDLSRCALPSEWKLYSWLYILFPTFYAFVLGDLLRCVLAVMGSIYLAKTLLKSSFDRFANIVILCGFAYGILPVVPTFALEFAALPLFMAVFIRLYQTGGKQYYFAVCSIGLFFSIAYFGFFICGYLLLSFLLIWVVKKKPAWRLLGATILSAVSFLITDYRLVYYAFFSGEELQRSQFNSAGISIAEALRTAGNAFLNGQAHSEALQKYLVLPVCMAFFLVINISYFRRKEWKKMWFDPFNWLMGWVVFNALVYGFDTSSLLRKTIAIIFPKLNGFSFARTLWFSPFVFYFAFCMVLCRICMACNAKLWRNIIIYSLCFACIGIICIIPKGYNNLRLNLSAFVKGIIMPENVREELTYQEFYAERLFSTAKEEIDYDGEYSIAFGMHPAVLQYNGIATLDGYSTSYSQEYKEEFRKLIAPFLAIDAGYRSYYDDWGGRAYVFSSTAAFDATRNMRCEEAALVMDSEVFRQVGGKYVFSRVRVSNAEELGFDLIGIFTHKETPYEIYVYSN